MTGDIIVVFLLSLMIAYGIIEDVFIVFFIGALLLSMKWITEWKKEVVKDANGNRNKRNEIQ